MAKRFFYVCAGLLCLAVAYHLGASRASAQAGDRLVAGITYHGFDGRLYVVTQGGDVYRERPPTGEWVFFANVFSAPTPATQSTWGSVKARYR